MSNTNTTPKEKFWTKKRLSTLRWTIFIIFVLTGDVLSFIYLGIVSGIVISLLSLVLVAFAWLAGQVSGFKINF